MEFYEIQWKSNGREGGTVGPTSDGEYTREREEGEDQRDDASDCEESADFHNDLSESRETRTDDGEGASAHRNGRRESIQQLYLFGRRLKDIIVAYPSTDVYEYAKRVFGHLQAPLLKIKNRRLENESSMMEEREIAAIFERLVYYFFTGDTSRCNQLLYR
jgi:hypothetical protein